MYALVSVSDIVVLTVLRARHANRTTTAAIRQPAPAPTGLLEAGPRAHLWHLSQRGDEGSSAR